jgi:hypothetical protein
MRSFVKETEEVEVVIAPAPVASSDPTHLARALLLQREVE